MLRLEKTWERPHSCLIDSQWALMCCVERLMLESQLWLGRRVVRSFFARLMKPELIMYHLQTAWCWLVHTLQRAPAVYLRCCQKEANHVALPPTFLPGELEIRWRQTFGLSMHADARAHTHSDSVTRFSASFYSPLRPCSLWTQINSLLYCVTYNLNLSLRSAIQS